MNRDGVALPAGRGPEGPHSEGALARKEEGDLVMPSVVWGGRDTWMGNCMS